MKKSTTKLFSLLLALCMMLGIAGSAIAEGKETPLVFGTGHFNQKFSPFYSDSVYDSDVSGMIQLGLMVLDRMGETIYNGIEGETKNFNGNDYTYYGPADLKVEYDQEKDITTYTTKLRDDLKFSDGEPVTADDLIFTYYVYLDPGYVGSTTMNSYPIIGLDSYVTQVPQELYDNFTKVFDGIYEAKADHEWAEGDEWTKEQQESVWAAMEAEWKKDLQGIVDYVVTNYAEMAEDIGKTAEEVVADADLQAALTMFAWNFGKYEDGKLTGGEKTWDLAAGEKPTFDEFYEVVYNLYEGDAVKYWDTEKVDNDDVHGTVKAAFVKEEASKDEAASAGVPNIAGIEKVDDYTVTVKTKGYEAPAIYSILGIAVAPKHYYGDPEQYDYDNNQFGHPFGDLSVVESKTSDPMGAGPYKFVEYSNKVVQFEANENYYKGAPKTKYLQFKESTDAELAPGLQTGTIDIADISGSLKNFEQLSSFNSNGELNGDVVTASLVDYRGYGYIGMMSSRIRVGEDSFSEESKNVRKALGTVMAVYRDVAFGSYYGDAADVINYPISNVSWAAPKATDDTYKVAFSTDVEGNDIYTSEMSQDDKYAAAIEAAKGFLISAGYTFDEAAGKFTAAPEGAQMEYTVWIGGGGTGDHPSFAVLTDAQNALKTIGITLTINDLSNTSDLWDGLDAGTVDIWCAAWQNNNPDPDMYQIYYSQNVPGLGGSDSNHYRVTLDELDQLILDGRKSDDQEYRKLIYKQALDIIVDVAVELPAYQRQNAVIFSSARINLDSLEDDLSTWWTWKDIVHLIEMK